MNIVINEALRAYIDPLTANEYAALERSLLAEGCRDALVLWGDMLIDGHNRYAICQKHGIPFNTVQNAKFTSIDDVQLWMIDNHLARRSVTDFQRGVLALRKKEIIAARASAQQDSAPAASATADNVAADAASTPEPSRRNTREELARAAGISSNTIGQIEKIQKTAAPELVAAVRAGTISINAAAAVASLPTSEQAAAVAGGKKELQQAAKMVREMKASSKPPKPAPAPTSAAEQGSAGGAGAPWDTEAANQGGSEIAVLNGRISELSAENAALKQQVAMLNAALEDARRAA